jgi:hypothetical protein
MKLPGGSRRLESGGRGDSLGFDTSVCAHAIMKVRSSSGQDAGFDSRTDYLTC